MTIDKNTLDKAKKWAGEILDRARPHQYADTAIAAAEVILSLPDVIVDGDKLREWIEGMKVSDQPGGAQALLDYLKRDFLPTPAPQVEIALGAWAMHPKHGKVLITSVRVDSDGEVRVHVKDSSSAVGTAPAWVTAADLSPLPDTHDDSDPDQGSNCQGALNSSPEPQPGEAWVINGLGGKMNAIRTEGGWVGEYGNYSDQYANRTPLRRLVPAQETRVLTTVEDYENAADGTVAHWGPTVIEKKNGAWYSTGSNAWNETDSTMSDHGPCTVLWEPEA